MAKAGRRHHLLVYSRMLNRWWPATLLLSLALFAIAWGVSRLAAGKSQPNLVMIMAGLGGMVFVFTLFLLIIRKFAYVQAFPRYLRLVTPFLRINISYKRFRGTTTTEMRALFPPDRVSNWQREIIRPLAAKTAILINLSSFPMPLFFLRMFLSPLFFKDKTPHIVILVEDWMGFSTELDSLRLNRGQGPKKPRYDQSILSRLPHQ